MKTILKIFLFMFILIYTGCSSNKTAPVIKTYKEYLPLISSEQKECLVAAKDVSAECYERAALEIDLCKEEVKLRANDRYRDAMETYTEEVKQMQLKKENILAKLNDSLVRVDGLDKKCSNLSTYSAIESMQSITVQVPVKYTNNLKKQKVTCRNAFYTKEDIKTAISNQAWHIVAIKESQN